MRLRERVAVVTGGGRGIGRAIALALAREGAAVALAARTAAELEAVRAEVEALGSRAISVVCDVADEESVHRLIAATLETFGALHIVVNNAGAVCRQPLVQTSVEEWDRVIGSQLRGAFLVTRFALPHLLAQGWGRVVTISSLAGRHGVPHRTAYCAAKWGQIGFTEALDEELRGTGVRAHVVCPGPAATRMRAEGFPSEDPASLIQPEDVAAVVIHLLTLPETAHVRSVDIRPGLEIRYR